MKVFVNFDVVDREGLQMILDAIEAWKATKMFKVTNISIIPDEEKAKV